MQAQALVGGRGVTECRAESMIAARLHISDGKLETSTSKRANKDWIVYHRVTRVYLSRIRGELYLSSF